MHNHLHKYLPRSEVTQHQDSSLTPAGVCFKVLHYTVPYTELLQITVSAYMYAAVLYPPQLTTCNCIIGGNGGEVLCPKGVVTVLEAVSCCFL